MTTQTTKPQTCQECNGTGGYHIGACFGAKPAPQTPAVVAESCEVCGKGESACAFEVACSCWYGVPCDVRPVPQKG
jgi:hypothetical protein